MRQLYRLQTAALRSANMFIPGVPRQATFSLAQGRLKDPLATALLAPIRQWHSEVWLHATDQAPEDAVSMAELFTKLRETYPDVIDKTG